MRKLILLSLMVLIVYLPTFAEDSDVSEINSSSDFTIVKSPIPGIRFTDHPTTGPALREPNMDWVNDTLAEMTLDEKVGQLIVTSQHVDGEANIDKYKVGGFIFLGNGQLASNIVATVNRLQPYSKYPLWFSIDSEAGVGARVADATIFPMIMAQGAANDISLAELCGKITARESRALGIQVTYGPVVDVNTEPLNPIISTRSISDDPMLVARIAKAFLKGARSEGVLCTFKHYPGHGGTAGDSHSSLPTIDLPLNEIKNTHIKPYEMLVASGDVDFVMTAHVWFSQVDTETPWPATLSKTFIYDILRGELNYKGLAISDSYGMSGLAIAVPDEEERAVLGIETGLDIILNPPTVSKAFNGIKNAVTSNRISMARIDESVRRVLIAKSRVGLPENTTVDPNLYKTVLQHPEHIEAVRKVCKEAITCPKYKLSTDTVLTTGSKPLVLTLAATQKIFYRFDSSYFTTPLKNAVPNADIRAVESTFSTDFQDQILSEAPDFDIVIVAGYDWWKISSQNQADLINALCELDVPVVYVDFGAPYHYLQIPNVDAIYCCYASVIQMQETAVDVLLGNKKALGELPVNVNGFTKNANDWHLY